MCMNGVGGCANASFCAYHSAYTLPGSSTPVLYASVPFTLGSRCQSAGVSPVQQPNGDVADVIADNLSHDNSESITDPFGSGWLTTHSEEVADQCKAFGPNDPNDPNGPTSLDAYMPTLGGSEPAGTLYDQLINNDHHFTQTEWSNSDNNCTASPTAGNIIPSFASPAVGCARRQRQLRSGREYLDQRVQQRDLELGDGSPTTFLAGAGGPTTVSHTYVSAGNLTRSRSRSPGARGSQPRSRTR